MCRTRAWRRHMEDTIVIRRLNRVTRQYTYFRHRDVNNISKKNTKLSDYIGTSYNFMFKTYTTHKNDSKYKSKYSPNKGGAWRDNNMGMCREIQKSIFLNILKEYGIR